MTENNRLTIWKFFCLADKFRYGRFPIFLEHFVIFIQTDDSLANFGEILTSNLDFRWINSDWVSVCHLPRNETIRPEGSL